MNDLINAEPMQPDRGAVEQLARDDLERKRFLTMAGRSIGTVAAASGLAAFIAACGEFGHHPRDVGFQSRHRDWG